MKRLNSAHITPHRESIADSQPIEHCSARSHANHICLQFLVAVSLVCFLSWKISCKHKSNSIKWKSTQPFAVELRTPNLLCKWLSEKKTRSWNRLINLTLDCIEWASLLIFSSIHIVIRLLMFICILWKKKLRQFDLDKTIFSFYEFANMKKEKHFVSDVRFHREKAKQRKGISMCNWIQGRLHKSN